MAGMYCGTVVTDIEKLEGEGQVKIRVRVFGGEEEGKGEEKAL